MKTNNKNTKHKLSNIIFLIVLIFLLTMLIVSAVKGISLCNHIQNNDVKEYVGEFTVRKQSSSKNTRYYITLENGDVVKADPDNIEDNGEFLSASSLSFTYSSPKYAFSSAYNCVEIRDAESGTVYLNSSDVYSDAKVGVYIAFAIAFVFFLITILVFLHTIGFPKMKRRKKRK